VSVRQKWNGANIPFQTQTSTGQDSFLEVPSDRCERILLGHTTNPSQLCHSLGILGLVYETDFLAERKIGPVNTLLSVDIDRVDNVPENFPLFFPGIDSCVTIAGGHGLKEISKEIKTLSKTDVQRKRIASHEQVQ
jgi:hypothetical protein